MCVSHLHKNIQPGEKPLFVSLEVTFLGDSLLGVVSHLSNACRGKGIRS